MKLCQLNNCEQNQYLNANTPWIYIFRHEMWTEHLKVMDGMLNKLNYKLQNYKLN